MDLDGPFEIEGQDSSFSVTQRQSTPMKKEHECEICGITFSTKFHFHKHLQTHSSVGVRQEPLDLSLTTISPIRHSLINMDTDDGELNVSCTTEEPIFSCEVCDFSSKFKQNLKRHLKIHINPRHVPKMKNSKANVIKQKPNLRCDKCNYTTPLKGNLSRHISKIHQKEETLCLYIREFCGKELRSKFSQKLHIHSVHEKKFKFTCPTCKKDYNQLRPFRGHLASHHGILKEKCDLCPATFNYMTCLAEHKQTVHENKTYKCSQPSISAVYFSSRPLRDHVKAEHSHERVPCDKCQKTFKWRSSLKYHKDNVHK